MDTGAGGAAGHHDILGDTGLWFVPTGEVLPSRKVSFSIHRTELDFDQGNTNVSFWPVPPHSV